MLYITTTPYLPCNNKNINRKELYDFYYTAITLTTGYKTFYYTLVTLKTGYITLRVDAFRNCALYLCSDKEFWPATFNGKCRCVQLPPGVTTSATSRGQTCVGT